ncbi:2-oxoglutarate dehydrogenase E1 component [Chitinophaga sp. GCM10012297]|uniref:oxoglutarate dehydrogenase (succinyl-transferring) n=1 Tax=Chitinophaga chungangae TaxID=2821488 RepID=A0ABS3YKJ2_9BACT|nr:2-oxoglutarate dehydrogenase E1 component [Chitinophaga chungangae]MBO9154930.1 2-oxoglutarate dehydrogenase E1 component [Chitinophaga chungangae]
MKDFSFVTNSHPAYIESLYQQYRADASSVDPEWIKFFEGFDFAVSNVNGKTGAAASGATSALPVSSDQLVKELGVFRLIQAYRKKGHLIAKTNPIRERKDRQPNLDLKFFGLADADLKTEFHAGQVIGLGKAPLEKIVKHLQDVYASKVGLEFTYINDAAKIEWLQKEMETSIRQPLNVEQKKRILTKLNQGVMFEKFLHTKYIGQKRFSLEGGETTIPALDAMINTAAEYGVQEAVIGMAHRGRLNILANILGKTYEQIFSEFEGTAIPDTTMGSGDVKYHLGFRASIQTPAGKEVNVQLTPNPSHLEVVDPVVVGFSRSKADVIYNSDYDKILPILIHGDAAIAGQGVVYEVAQMSKLRGYYTGGTMHFVINNQIGFTTDFEDARSADYCTSVASIVQAPVFHVNGDDVEATVKVAEIATRYRQEFNSDIYIDMVCYRKHGHNEGDDPKFTQPKLYSAIDKHPNPREIYSQQLIANGDVDAALATEMEKVFWADLQARLDDVKQHPLPYKYQQPDLWWKELRKSTPEDFGTSPATAISKESLDQLFAAIMAIPEGFKPLRKVEKLLQDKQKLFAEQGLLDWSSGELLAYASILKEGRDVRLSGQDVKRGTFSHRHAALRNEETDEEYSRLSNLGGDQGKFRIYNSLLSEFAVLGFEYGYSIANPYALTIWEAQFGDFMNGGQTLIDQFITSAETKWQKQSGLVMLLPHGYEGQGPEHSSARLERFLQQCAEHNIFVTNCTTAASFFHALRRQLALPFRKPMINFSPKANLRHVRSYSPAADFTEGGFREVLDDPFITDASRVKKILLCSGKMYFDLSEKQIKEDRKDVAIIRLEQLYPLPVAQLEAIQQKYKGATWFWVQEEPLNMGAAGFLQMNLKQFNYGVISRNPSASTATGYAKVHAQEQQEIIDTAFNI